MPIGVSLGKFKGCGRVRLDSDFVIALVQMVRVHCQFAI